MNGQNVTLEVPSLTTETSEITKFRQNIQAITNKYIKKINQFKYSTPHQQAEPLFDSITNDMEHLITELKSSINELNASKEKLQETLRDFEEYMYPEPIFEDPRFPESEEYEESPKPTPTQRNILEDKIFRNVFSSDSDSECSNNEFDEIINDHRTTRFGCHDIHADDFLD